MAAVRTALNIGDLVAFIHSVSDAYTKGVAKATLEATEMAYRDALLAIKANFNNTPGYVRSGQMGNSLYRGYDPAKAEGFLGVRLAYGRIQEEGGTVVPKAAKHLWVKQYTGVDAQFKRWQPKDFMAARARDPNSYSIFRNPHTGKLIAAYQAKGAGPAQIQALFSLVNSVTIKGRPYLHPAVVAAYGKLAGLIKMRVAEELKG